MQTALDWAEVSPPPAPASALMRATAPALAAVADDALPPAVKAAVWRGTELGQAASVGVGSSGWAGLDAELPGGGWPLRSVTEILAAQPSVLEWRLLGPALRPLVAAGRQIVVVGPPRIPHVPGLLHEGLDERQLVWIQADKPAERLWVTEQLIKSNSTGAIVAWLSQVRQEQLRRLQVCAAGFEGLVFLCRQEAARHEASAAPLRVLASVGLDWELKVNVFKRRGPAHDGLLSLPSVPGGLASVLTPRLRRPSRLIQRDATRETREAADAVGRTPAAPVRQLAAVR